MLATGGGTADKYLGGPEEWSDQCDGAKDPCMVYFPTVG